VYGAEVNISELARGAGIAPSAVRWYERVGVIPRVARQDNGYRTFDETDAARLRLVVALRRLGLTPEQAGRLARLCLERGPAGSDMTALLAGQREEIARQRRDLDRLEAELLDLEDTVAATGRATLEAALMPAEPVRVLFVCTGNSARSQLAEALLGRLGGSDFVAASAGTEPGGVNPYTVRVLGGRGIDWSGATSKSVAGFVGQPWDYVITVCDRARQACPVFPGDHNSLHWGLDDPAEVGGTDDDRLAAFEHTATELTLRLRPFIEIARRAGGRAMVAADPG
jgi:arsenate reductase (thioredoxin)